MSIKYSDFEANIDWHFPIISKNSKPLSGTHVPYRAATESSYNEGNSIFLHEIREYCKKKLYFSYKLFPRALRYRVTFREQKLFCHKVHFIFYYLSPWNMDTIVERVSFCYFFLLIFDLPFVNPFTDDPLGILQLMFFSIC